MNYSEFVKEISKKTEFSERKVREILSTAVEVITNALVNGDTVRIPNLGTFRTMERKERKGKNPQTGEEITIPAKVIPKFKAANALAEAVK